MEKFKRELEDAFSHNGEHLSLNGSKIKIDGIITITSGRKTALKTNIDLHEKCQESYIRVYDREDIIHWCQKYPIPKNLTPKLVEIGT